MNNSEHDPYDPDQDNDPVPDDAALSGGDDTGDRRNDSAAHPSDDEVWRDLVSRLEQTDSKPDPAQNQDGDLGDGRNQDRGVQGQRQDRGQPGTDSESAPAPDPVLGHPRPAAPQPRRMDREHLGGPRDYTPEEEEEDDSFVPEDPPSPLAGTEPLVVLAWCGTIGGPLVLLLSAFFWRAIPMLAVVGIIAAFLASVVFLLMRLPAERSDDNDDGAVV